MGWKLSDIPGPHNRGVEQATAAPGEKRNLTSAELYEWLGAGTGPVRLSGYDFVRVVDLLAENGALRWINDNTVLALGREVSCGDG